MRDPSIDSYQSWSATQVLDSVRTYDLRCSLVPIDAADFSTLCNELTISMSRLFVPVHGISFFTPLAAVDTKSDHLHTIRYILSKVINQRCQARKFASVVLERLDKHPQIGRQLEEIVLCSLLGNHRCSDPRSRPLPPIRSMLMSLLRPDSSVDKSKRWLRLLLQKCRLLVIYCLREHALFLVLEHPEVAAQLSKLIWFKQFKHHVRAAMNVLRDWLCRMLDCPDSSLYKASFGGNDPDSRWATEVAFIMQPYNEAILRISYKRSKESFRQFLLSVGNRCTRGEPIPCLVTPDEIACMRQLAERVSHIHTSDALYHMLDWMQHFRVIPEIVRCMRVLMACHAKGDTRPDVLERALIQLRDKDLRSFHLFQIATHLLQDAQRVRLLGHLPVDTLLSQIDACQTGFGMKQIGVLEAGPGRVFAHLFTFYYCDVCFATFSMVVDSGSDYKQDFSFGTRNAVLDHDTNELYCNRKKVSYRGRCEDTPLRRVLLVGSVLDVNGKMITICGQPRCGRVFVINEGCVTNERGRSCCYCTMKMKEATPAFLEVLAKRHHGALKPRVCAVCNIKFKTTREVCIFPHGVYLCRKHANVSEDERLRIKISELATVGELSEGEKKVELVACMVDLHEQYKCAAMERRVQREAKMRQLVARSSGE